MLPVTYDREIISLSKFLQYGCIDIDVRNCVTFQHSRARRFALALGVTSCTTHVRTWKKKLIDKNKHDEKKTSQNRIEGKKEIAENGAIAHEYLVFFR